jgi:hypothetical protein
MFEEVLSDKVYRCGPRGPILFPVLLAWRLLNCAAPIPHVRANLLPPFTGWVAFPTKCHEVGPSVITKGSALRHFDGRRRFFELPLPNPVNAGRGKTWLGPPREKYPSGIS